MPKIQYDVLVKHHELDAKTTKKKIKLTWLWEKVYPIPILWPPNPREFILSNNKHITKSKIENPNPRLHQSEKLSAVNFF